MSAPLVVNTVDHLCWTRRAVGEDGTGWYALADFTVCPPFVMASYDELADLGIVGTADALPVPGGAA